jgi:hypothetical protein
LKIYYHTRFGGPTVGDTRADLKSEVHVSAMFVSLMAENKISKAEKMLTVGPHNKFHKNISNASKIITGTQVHRHKDSTNLFSL